MYSFPFWLRMTLIHWRIRRTHPLKVTHSKGEVRYLAVTNQMRMVSSWYAYPQICEKKISQLAASRCARMCVHTRVYVNIPCRHVFLCTDNRNKIHFLPLFLCMKTILTFYLCVCVLYQHGLARAACSVIHCTTIYSRHRLLLHLAGGGVGARRCFLLLRAPLWLCSEGAHGGVHNTSPWRFRGRGEEGKEGDEQN